MGAERVLNLLNDSEDADTDPRYTRAQLLIRLAGSALSALHLPSHVPDQMGAVHGPMDVCVSCRPPRHVDQETVGAPQEYSTRAAIEKARVALSGHKTGHTPILNMSVQIAHLPVSA